MSTRSSRAYLQLFGEPEQTLIELEDKLAAAGKLLSEVVSELNRKAGRRRAGAEHDRAYSAAYAAGQVAVVEKMINQVRIAVLFVPTEEESKP